MPQPHYMTDTVESSLKHNHLAGAHRKNLYVAEHGELDYTQKGWVGGLQNSGTRRSCRTTRSPLVPGGAWHAARRRHVHV